jgi:c-di-GMP-binding flagellar brake protein YcgR
MGGNGRERGIVHVLPQVGQVVRLYSLAVQEGKESPAFKSRVAEVMEGKAAIELPINEETGRIGFFPVGSRWNLSYVGPDGTKFGFATEIVGSKQDNISMLVISLPQRQDIQKFQRRDFVRVPAAFDMAVKTTDMRNYHFLATTIDVSGGGLAFECSSKYVLQEKDQLLIWMALPNRGNTAVDHVHAEAEITRVKQPETKGEHQVVSVKFMQISEGDRVKIVRACYEKQLEWKKKRVDS